MTAASGNRKGGTSLPAALGLLLAGALLLAAFNTGMEATNTLEFCISCHEMEKNVYREYRRSTHFSSPSGAGAICSDCHVPKAWLPKVWRKIQASRELYHWALGTIDTPEKFEARRLELAERVWQRMRETDSAACRGCHDFSRANFGRQARFAARIHRDAVEAKKSCIDCHQGITHQLPVMEEAAPEKGGEKAFDEEYAEEIMDICAGCHGEYGQGTPDGEYPRLAGLDAAYLTRQLELFKSRERLNIPMLPYATERELPKEDVETIAAWLSAIELPSRLEPVDEKAEGFNAFARLKESERMLNIARYPGSVEAGGRLYRRECAGCHGSDGRGNREKTIPPLTGQHSAYLLRQVERFRKGERVHDAPGDAEVFRQFGDGEIGDILAWLSVQDDD